MALTPRLDAYLSIERQMMALDELGDPLADSLRDAMDRIWYALSDEEHRFLDSRHIGDLASLYSVNLSVGIGFFVQPPEPPPPSRAGGTKTYPLPVLAA